MKKMKTLFVMCAAVALAACNKKPEEPFITCPYPPADDDSITMVVNDSTISPEGEVK